MYFKSQLFPAHVIEIELSVSHSKFKTFTGLNVTFVFVGKLCLLQIYAAPLT